MPVNGPAVMLAASVSGEQATGRQAWGLLWKSSHRLATGVAAWMVAGAVFPTVVVITLGLIVGSIPGAVSHGIGSASGHRLIMALFLAALVYGLSLIVDPAGNALGTASAARITGQVQERLLTAVAGPVGVSHLEDTEVLDRLSRAEGSLTGFFPGDAPVTWAGSFSGRVAGIIGCLVVAVFQWWLRLLLLVMWLVVRARCRPGCCCCRWPRCRRWPRTGWPSGPPSAPRTPWATPGARPR